MRKPRKNKRDNVSSPFKGTTIPEERKKKIQLSSHKKSVLQKDLNGNIIKKYDSLSSASRETGVNLGNTSSCCHGRVSTAGGFIWEFAD